jgi:hypothetical protein
MKRNNSSIFSSLFFSVVFLGVVIFYSLKYLDSEYNSWSIFSIVLSMLAFLGIVLAIFDIDPEYLD